MGLPFSGLGSGGTGTILGGGGGGASLPNATAAGEVPAATGPGTAYTAGPIGLGGLLAAPPSRLFPPFQPLQPARYCKRRPLRLGYL